MIETLMQNPLFVTWALVGIVFMIDLAIPDPIPFADELLLGIIFTILSALLAAQFIDTWLQSHQLFLIPDIDPIDMLKKVVS